VREEELPEEEHWEDVTENVCAAGPSEMRTQRQGQSVEDAPDAEKPEASLAQIFVQKKRALKTMLQRGRNQWMNFEPQFVARLNNFDQNEYPGLYTYIVLS
jgi:hypothetical protein